MGTSDAKKESQLGEGALLNQYDLPEVRILNPGTRTQTRWLSRMSFAQSAANTLFRQITCDIDRLWPE